MAGLEGLPTELLEKIFFHQKAVEDMISSTRLLQVLSQPRVWRNLLTKATTTTMIDTVDQWGPLKSIW